MPYHCTFCYNHVYNRMFKECGLYCARVIPADRIEHVIKHYPPVVHPLFGDTFSLTVDDWLREFSEQIPSESGAFLLPDAAQHLRTGGPPAQGRRLLFISMAVGRERNGSAAS